MSEKKETVPEDCVLTSRAYRDFLQYNRLAGYIDAASGIKADTVNEPANEKTLENIRLQAGDVLVALSTDPGWAPLFLRAKAVVMKTLKDGE